MASFCAFGMVGVWEPGPETTKTRHWRHDGRTRDPLRDSGTARRRCATELIGFTSPDADGDNGPVRQSRGTRGSWMHGRPYSAANRRGQNLPHPATPRCYRVALWKCHSRIGNATTPHREPTGFPACSINNRLMGLIDRERETLL